MTFLALISHEPFDFIIKIIVLDNRVFFVSNQKVHPSGALQEVPLGCQQIFSQLLRYRAFAVNCYSFLPGASTCEKLCW